MDLLDWFIEAVVRIVTEPISLFFIIGFLAGIIMLGITGHLV